MIEKTEYPPKKMFISFDGIDSEIVEYHLAPVWHDAVKDPPKEDGWYVVEDKYGEIRAWYFMTDHNDLEKLNIVRYYGVCIPEPPERSEE
jgi:hypothetical protein